MNEIMPVVTRFAPSPTGYMHIGSLRTALFAYLFARKNQGIFILRIEDTDKNREVPGSIEHIQESLSWLGIEWDYGPNIDNPFGSCIQSERLPVYKEYAERLLKKGFAYPDPHTPEEVERFRELAIAEKRPFLIRDHRPDTFSDWDGETPLRLKVPKIQRYTWYDEVRGELSGGEEMLDDFIIIKADGFPTYNFAHIVDDYEMGVTHVMRGDEFISSTPKFLSIYDALEIPRPKFVSLPPIMNADRTKKLGKRDGAKDILEYRTEGYLPDTMRNFLALIGWNPGTQQELFSKEELIEAFTLEKIQKGGGAFNEEKLLWMNRQFLNTLTTDQYVAYLLDDIPEKYRHAPLYNDELLGKLIPILRERTHIKGDFITGLNEGEYDFAFFQPTPPLPLVQWKNDSTIFDTLPRLEAVYAILKDAEFDSPETIKSSIWPYTNEVGRGEVLWPLRVCLSGKERSPDPFSIAYVIGKPQTLLRIQSVCDRIKE